MSEWALEDLLGRSPQMEQVRRFARRAGRTDVPVLLTGETGTGKTLLARLIHSRGSRRHGPFISLNCAGIPDALFEAELFGHRRGAFTGAVESRRGLLEASHAGTLFLDEVADLPSNQQAKLLTVLEEGRVRRVGEERWQDIDIRVLAATSADLNRAMAEGRFRPDLYHRIALLRCTLPPLRDRREDIVFLSERFLHRFASKHRLPAPALGAPLLERLLRHPWPGNVRELAHVIEAALILAEGRPLAEEHLDEAMAFPDGPSPIRTARRRRSPGRKTTGVQRTAPAPSPSGPPLPRDDGAGDTPDAPPVEPIALPPGAQGTTERERIRAALAESGGDTRRAARALGLPPSTLRDRILRHGLQGEVRVRGERP